MNHSNQSYFNKNSDILFLNILLIQQSALFDTKYQQDRGYSHWILIIHYFGKVLPIDVHAVCTANWSVVVRNRSRTVRRTVLPVFALLAKKIEIN
ncbi:MAG TPA: hypothetical protein VF281_03835 [Candidatus Saccharimonadales bacterium]